MASQSDSRELLIKSSLGRKVSIRLIELDGGYRDLLGELMTPESVKKKDGSVVKFDHSQVFAFRLVEEGKSRARGSGDDR